MAGSGFIDSILLSFLAFNFNGASALVGLQALIHNAGPKLDKMISFITLRRSRYVYILVGCLPSVFMFFITEITMLTHFYRAEDYPHQYTLM